MFLVLSGIAAFRASRAIGVGSKLWLLYGKSVGERTPPCGPPVFNWRLNVVYAFLPFYVVSVEFSDGVGYASVCELVN